MGVVGAGEEDALGRIVVEHEVQERTFAGDRTERNAVRDGFAPGGKIGLDAAERLITAEARAKAGFDFVEDQEKAVLVGEAAKGFEVAGLGADNADVLENGFEDDGGEWDAFGDPGDGARVVELDGMNEGGFLGRDAGRDGSEGIFVADDLFSAELIGRSHEIGGDHVVVAVVAALDFQDVRTAGPGARDADRLGGGLAACIHELDTLGERDALEKAFGEFALLAGGAGAKVGKAVAERGGDGGVHVGVVVPEDIGRETEVIIDVVVAVEIPDVRALAARERDAGIGAAVERGEAAGNPLFVAAEDGAGAGPVEGRFHEEAGWSGQLESTG